MSELNDKELFESAISDAPTVTEATPEPVVEPVKAEAEVTDGPARDEKGRFAPKSQPEPTPAPVEAAPQPAAQAQPDKEAHVPSWRLREVNDAREAAERRAQEAALQLQQLQRQMEELRQQNQPKPEPIDVFADPVGAFKQQLSPLEQQLRSMQANFNLRASKAEAIAIHGRDAVAEMERAVQEAINSGNPEMRHLSVQMQNSDDPVGVAMQWHQRDKLLKETGGDLSSYRSKMLEDALKDPAFLAKAMEAARAQASGQAQPNGKPTTQVQLPPSLNRAPSAASPHEDPGSLADNALYSFATR